MAAPVQRAKQILWDRLPVRLLLRLELASPAIRPPRLTHLLDAVAARRGLPGSIVEVGCYRGGTTLAVNRALRSWGEERHYLCVDTFDGFVEQQFGTDGERWGIGRTRHFFDVTSQAKVERMLRHHGFDRVELVRGDIVELPETALPDEVCVALMDVDLTEPTLAGLRKLHSRLVPGGVILVDDCDPQGGPVTWPAGGAYSQFCSEAGLPEVYESGFGVVARPQTDHQPR